MYTVIARKWFERTNGNTYHSCEVYKDSELVKRVPFAYGYGEQWKQTAHEVLVNAELFVGDYWAFLQHTRENREGFLFSVTDVQRKKDL
jgi:hypothetical protein